MVEEVRINSWEEFREALPGGQSRLPVPQIWRGQEDSLWPLSSSFERMYRKHRDCWDKNSSKKGQKPSQPSRDTYEKFRDEYLLSFKRFAVGVRGPSPTPLNTEQWWALGRHYGLRTPLLDWSERPYVAVFFAVTGLINRLKRTCGDVGSVNLDGSSCTVFRLMISDPIESLSDKELNILRPQVDELSRMHNQRGLFTWLDSPKHQDLESFLDEYNASSMLTKFVISDKIAIEAFRDLYNFGIDWKVIYPDLAGAALAANQNLEIPDDLWDLRLC